MAERPREFPHLYLRGGGRSERYTTRGSGRTPLPPHRDREAHARKLERALDAAISAAQQQRAQRGGQLGEPGFYLEFELTPADLVAVEKLANRQQKIEILAVRPSEDPNQPTRATVFIPERSAAFYLHRVEQYRTMTNNRSGKPRNEGLVSRLEDVRLAAVRSLFTDDEGLFPEARRDPFWWELWLRKGKVRILHQAANQLDIRVGEDQINFPERDVVLVQATQEQLGRLITNSDAIAEIRIAKDSPATFLQMGPQEQEEWVADLIRRLRVPPPNAACACILDTGVTRLHPLIEPALFQNDEHTYDPNWGLGDNPARGGHGSRMTGLALYGDLESQLLGNEEIVLTHRLESVKILPPGEAQNDKRLYGHITAEGVARPEVAAPNRRRVFCLAITNPIDITRGRPTSWSAKIDQLAFGENNHKRLICISAGNIRDEFDPNTYPDANDLRGIEDPAQSWNALTVGAYTGKTRILDQDYAGWNPVAPDGGLSPRSRTSVIWHREWPVKPDVLLEGGNIARNGDEASPVDDLQLLTTNHRPNIRLFTTIGDTSAATALATQMAAQIMTDRPNLWPETIRALIVHSAEWTPTMRATLDEANTRELKTAFVRRYGYGVPNLQRALLSSRNDVTLVVQDQLTPFIAEGGIGKTRDMNLHALPWPAAQLRELRETIVEMRVTLSYFIDPNPGERGWTRKYRYASHGLRFEVKRSLENLNGFRLRINRAVQLDERELEMIAGDVGGDNWLLGAIRNRGSIHSDIWRGPAIQLAERDSVGIFPVGGWWKERPQLGRANDRARYALVVSIRATAGDTDIYTPIANLVAQQIEV